MRSVPGSHTTTPPPVPPLEQVLALMSAVMLPMFDIATMAK